LALGLVMTENTKWGVESEDGVSVLTADNFDEFLSKNKYVFVKFYAPWCGHCKKMAPDYAKLARQMDEGDTGLVIAQVDLTVHRDIGTRFNVKGFPTLKFFLNGEPIDYNGARESKDIEAFCKKNMAVTVSEVTDMQKLQQISQERLSVVVYTETMTDSMKGRVLAMDASNDKVGFHITSMVEAKTFMGVENSFAMVVYRSFDDGKKILGADVELTVSQMTEFYNSVKFASVVDFDQEAAENIFGQKKNAIFFFTDATTHEKLAPFQELASSKKFDIVFSKSAITKDLGQRLSEYLGVTAAHDGEVRIIKHDGKDLQKYALKKEVTVDNLAEFITAFNENKLEVYRKSEKPVENDTEAVKTIVSDDFDEKVLGSNKFVLLEIYAPWCGHCKSLAPHYEKAAKELVGKENLIIAKYNGAANEHAKLKYEGFPTIKFYKKDKSAAALDFDGARDYDGIMAYLKKQMGEEFDAAPVSEEL